MTGHYQEWLDSLPARSKFGKRKMERKPSMTHAAIQVTVALTSIDCKGCGGTYAISEQYRSRKAEAGGYWSCPYCKGLWGYGDQSENEKLKREIAAERNRTQAALSRENEERAARERAERKLKRVQRGVCPHCNRTFQNLAAHMKCKHEPKP